MEQGSVGIGLVEADVSTYCVREIVHRATAEPSKFEFEVSLKSPARWLVFRNVSGNGQSSIRIGALRCFRLKRPRTVDLHSIEASTGED